MIYENISRKIIEDSSKLKAIIGFSGFGKSTLVSSIRQLADYPVFDFKKANSIETDSKAIIIDGIFYDTKAHQHLKELLDSFQAVIVTSHPIPRQLESLKHFGAKEFVVPKMSRLEILDVTNIDPETALYFSGGRLRDLKIIDSFSGDLEVGCQSYVRCDREDSRKRIESLLNVQLAAEEKGIVLAWLKGTLINNKRLEKYNIVCEGKINGRLLELQLLEYLKNETNI